MKIIGINGIDFVTVEPSIQRNIDTLTILVDEIMRKTFKSYFYTASKRGGVSPW